MRRAARIVAAAAALVCAGCARTADARVASQVRMDHGLRPGSRMAELPVGCLGGEQRTLAARGETQIVTFATPFDCTACTPHLAGVPKVEHKAGVAGRSFMVVWAPHPATLEHDLGPNRPDIPVCVDKAGTTWDRHNLLHTPFTAVIRDGTVVYMHDGNLLTHREEVMMEQDLKRLTAAD